MVGNHRTKVKTNEVNSNEVDLLAKFNLCYVLRTFHIANGPKHYKIRYCVKRKTDNESVTLTATALVNGTTLRETLNELIKCAEFENSHRILMYSSVFIFQDYLFVEHETMAYDLEQILRVKYNDIKQSGKEQNESILSEEIIGHILRKVLKALSYLHRYALHNNLIARSVILTSKCDVKLTGFKWTIMKNDDIKKMLSLRSNRFFGQPTQWAPEEALNDIEHYGPHTELWHVGLLIPEMVTGQTFHATNSPQLEDVRQFAEQLMKFQLPLPYNGWFPSSAKYSLSSELLRLWHCLMQPHYKNRPTINDLLDRKISSIIRSTSKSRIKETLLVDAQRYRIANEEEVEPLRKWTQLMNYSRERGADDITRLESLYLGMGRNEFFSSVCYSDDFDDENPIFSIDFRKVPTDLLQCVFIEVIKKRKKVTSVAITIHLDMCSTDICTVVCRHIYKMVQNEIIGFVNYIRISLQVDQVLKWRERTKAKYGSWQIHLEEDGVLKKMEATAHVQVIFDGPTAKNVLENAEKGLYEINNFSMLHSPVLEMFEHVNNFSKQVIEHYFELVSAVFRTTDAIISSNFHITNKMWKS